MDRESATPDQCGAVAGSIFDLFALQGASEEQLDFPLLYASGRAGWASTELPPQVRSAGEPGLTPRLILRAKTARARGFERAGSIP